MKALEHIESSCGALPSLNDLSRAAGLSPYHFHRIFKMNTGEGTYKYVQRLILERAARNLIYTTSSIINIAMEAGYECPGDFSRAFKKLFGLSPSKYRKSRLDYLAYLQERTKIDDLILANKIQITFKRFRPITVASLRHVGPYEESVETWYKLSKTLSHEGIDVLDNKAYGISHDIPNITKPENFRMDVSFHIPEEIINQKLTHYIQKKYGIVFRTIGGYGNFVSCRILGCHSLIYPIYNFVHTRWKVKNNTTLQNTHGFEIYYNSPRNTHADNLLTEVFIPTSRR